MRIIFHSTRGFSLLLFFSIFPLFIFEVGEFALLIISVSFSNSTSIISSSFSSIFGIFSFFNPLIFYFIFKFYFK
ncbi:unnamed protein product [Meloidogyne enterolobii]|uniref:Uncharacterized protein n=1 Tax=Meloidogyne enterolobii TaxID=390850 RepID=A0ACB1AIP1_MELEN